MLTLEQIRHLLRDRNLRDVARESGLHYNVIYRLANDAVKNPSYETTKRISDYLTGGAK